MDWLSVRGVLFIAAAAMFAYSARRLVIEREARLLRLGQVLFWAAFMLISIPMNESANLERDWPYWSAFVMLLASFGVTIAHKTRRKPRAPETSADSDSP